MISGLLMFFVYDCLLSHFLNCRNKCGCETHPLLKTINRELRGLGQGSTDCNFPGNYRLNSIELSPSPYSKCTGGNFARVAGDCAKYLVCDNGDYQEHECPPGLHWNRVRTC